MPVDVAARVLYNTRLSSDYNVLALAAPEVAAAVQPGQFVMIKPGHGTDPLLRRPFSVFEILRGDDEIEGITLLSKRIGVTTAMLHDAVPGDVIACLGPLGNAFEIPAPPTEAWLVAGGVGLAPFATMAEALQARGTRTKLFYGARSAADLFYLDWFEQRGVRVIVSTEDGTRGDRGRITLPLERELGRARDADVRIYACGPERMLGAVSALAVRYGRPSQVSVERTMGCGMGGCYSCVIPVHNDGGGRHYVRSCLNGPVFDGAAILWD